MESRNQWHDEYQEYYLYGVTLNEIGSGKCLEEVSQLSRLQNMHDPDQ